MNRKIIIKSDDFNREISSFLNEIGADMPLDWNNGVLERIKHAVIETFEKMGVTLEIDDRFQSTSPYLTQREGDIGMHQ